MYTVIQQLTRDGRDRCASSRTQMGPRTPFLPPCFLEHKRPPPSYPARSLDYKISGFDVPPGCWDAAVCSDIAPSGDEMVLPKTSSSVFM